MSVYDKLDTTDEFGGIESRPLPKKQWRLDDIPIRLSDIDFLIWQIIISYETMDQGGWVDILNPVIDEFLLDVLFDDGSVATVAVWRRKWDSFKVIRHPHPDTRVLAVIQHWSDHNVQKQVIDAVRRRIMEAWQLYLDDVQEYEEKIHFGEIDRIGDI